MTAVAVWPHRPDAAALLAARVARGWRPTPTATRDGDQILGYAACLLNPNNNDNNNDDNSDNDVKR